MVEAGAGTGKTTALVARIVVWSVGAGWETSADALAATSPDTERIASRVLDRLVAITFTEAAAAEMAERVGDALASIERGDVPLGVEKALLPAADDVRTQRSRALLTQLDRLVVRTIHAWCRRLLVAWPLEAGIHPAFEVDAEGALRSEVIREVIESAIGRDYASPLSSPLVQLAELEKGPSDLERALAELVEAGVPARALEDDPLAPARIAALRHDLGATLDSFLSTADEALEGLGTTRAGETGAWIAALRPRLEMLDDTPEALQTLCDSVRDELGDLRSLRAWSRGRFETKGEKGLLEPLGDSFRALAGRLERQLAHLRRLEPERLELARRGLYPLLAQVERELRSRGVETFAGLLERADALLTEHADVCGRLRAGLDQLLVDEFQDTDRVQCAIIGRIALEGPAEQRPGLFIVGDPKQSIYGWRGADLAAYDRFVERVEAAGGARYTLAVSFRSAPVVLDEVERTLAPLMKHEPGVQPPFAPLAACESRRDDPGFRTAEREPVEYWVSWPRPSTDAPPAPSNFARAARVEARALAADLRALHDEHGVAWRDVGVLFRSRGELDVYLRELREAGIPHLVNGDRSYYRRREIIEASALVRCVLDPNDHLALLAWLRSASVGVPDAALIPLWARTFPDRMSRLIAPEAEALDALSRLVEEAAAAVPPDVPGRDEIAGWESCLVSALEAIATARASFDSDPSDTFVERLRARTLLEVTESARYQGAWRVANLERFFRHLTLELESVGREGVLRSLRSRVARAEDAEEARPKETLDDAVQILTIHQAKGLDFEHVYLMQLHKGGGRDDPLRSAAERVGGAWEYRLFEWPTPGFRAIGERREATDTAERIRTLYVAMTRARRRLVLAGRWPEDHRRRDPANAESHVDLLCSRAEGPSEIEPMAASGEQSVHAAGALWVFPDAAPAAARATAKSAGPTLPPLSRVASDAASVAARRNAARRRMQRPTSRPASEEAHHALHEVLADAAGDESRAGPRARGVALAVGSAVHRLLEEIDLSQDPAAELERLRARLPEWLAALADADRGDALARAHGILDRLAGGALLGRLGSLREHVVARELPILCPPPVEDDAAPVGHVAGAIDLVYRDPDSGALVVADYKTDRLESDAELERRVETYALQGRVYARALRDALDLAETPRFELWFLDRDVIRVPELPGE